MRTRPVVILTAVVIIAGLTFFSAVVVALFRAPAVSTGPVAAPTLDVAAVSGRLFVIDPARSEARFLIDEVLRGRENTVVGATNMVGGQLSFDLDEPQSAVMGQILVNARDLTTDDDFRNRAIANEILVSGLYEFITFTPTAINGLPADVEIGQSYPFEIEGLLKVADNEQPVTFNAAVTLLSENELQGTARAVIEHADFDIFIPFSSAVQAVSDEVILELDFVSTGK